MNPLLSVPSAETVRETERGWNAESPVMAPGVLVTAPRRVGVGERRLQHEGRAGHRDDTVGLGGCPTVIVSPAANVSGLREVPGWTEMVVAPAAAAAASVLDPGGRR